MFLQLSLPPKIPNEQRKHSNAFHEKNVINSKGDDDAREDDTASKCLQDFCVR